MMQTIAALIRKEFYQVVRDRNMLRLIFLMPLVQLLVLGYSITTDVKSIATAFYDFDRSDLSREYMRSFSAGGYFEAAVSELSLLESEKAFKDGTYKVNGIIPNDFTERLHDSRRVDVGLVVDGTNANAAAIALGYAGEITNQFNQKVTGMVWPLNVRVKKLYNPEGESVYFMVPGIVAVLVTMISVMLTSMAIVREREVGTLEQLMVTPISTPALLLGKAIPFALLTYIEMSIALAFGVLWFKIPFAGSWVLLYLVSFVYLFTTLGVGIFISTITNTQQQAMFFAWFFTIFTILTSGFFTPIANMPEVVQYITYLNPLRYFMKIVRAIMMKGVSIDIIYPEVLALMIFALVVFSIAWLRFSKRVK